MGKKGLVVLVLILCVGLLLTGCPKKTVMKEEPSMKKAEEPVAEREKAAKLAAEQGISKNPGRGSQEGKRERV